MEENLLNDRTEEMIASAVREKKMKSKICYKILETGELEFPGFPLKVLGSIGGWYGPEEFQLAHKCNEEVYE